MHNKCKKTIDKLKSKHNITTLEYLGEGYNFNMSCGVCGTNFSGDIAIKLGYVHPCPTCLDVAKSKPREPVTREGYIRELTEMGYELLEDNVGIRETQDVKCTVCGYVHNLIPFRKLQAAKKYDGGGRCVKCRDNRIKEDAYKLGQQYVDEIKLKGYEVLSEGPYERNDNIDVIRKECGHQFNARIIYLWNGKSQCSVCNNAAKPKRLQKAHEPRLIEYRKTASEWELYKSAVAVATTRLYREYKHIINPNNYPKAKEGRN